MNVFRDHFMKLNKCDAASPLQEISGSNGNMDIAEFDEPFVEDEVVAQIKKLKNNKSPGIDMLINECFKHSKSILIKVITKFFNVILWSGKVPTDWTSGLICPIYKKKGSKEDPDNYRGITLLSCLGKLFTAVVNERLTSYFEDHNLLGEEQVGFRENYSTLDHIFLLHSVIDLHLSQRKRIYCAFIDYKKAFDSVNRTSLWHKMIRNGIHGKLFRVIQNMYNDAKSCVMVEGDKSDFFGCNIGVRQGENLSPFLFALYLNDFELFVRDRYEGIDLVPSVLNLSLNSVGVDVYLKLFSLLYADDTIILADSEKSLQIGLNAIHDYCDVWSLKVNVDKTKIVIFSRGKVRKYGTFKFGDSEVQVVDDYIYLGTTFNYRNDFKKAQIKQINQARRAMYSLIVKARKLKLPVDLELDLFDRLVVPILLYGCEIWGYEDLHQIEKLHTQFCKQMLRLNKTTAHCMVLGELGRFDLCKIVQERMLNFWLRTITGKEFKLSTIACNILKILSDSDIYSSPWILKIKQVLNSLGMSNLWYEYEKIDKNWFKMNIKLKLSDILRQKWWETIQERPVCINYRIFKTDLKLESYILKIPDPYRTALTKFRCGNHRLPVVTGRFNGINRSDRYCTTCNSKKIGDEYHYLFECSVFNNERRKYLKVYFRNRPNTFKMNELLNSGNVKDLTSLAKFCRIIMLHFSSK